MALCFQRFDAPAKLNLMLKILDKRPDGYHNLYTLFQLIDLIDTLEIATLACGKIKLTTPIANIPTDNNLIVRAANLLKAVTGTSQGAVIHLTKRIPVGGGLGGGSSDAATTLLALNHLWETRLPRLTLMKLAAQLGADVPLFVLGKNAIGKGIGEKLTPCTLPKKWYVLLHPPLSIATKDIFMQWQLTRCASTAIIPALPNSDLGVNDLESIVRSQYTLIDQAMQALSVYGKAQLTGSGSCVFLACTKKAIAQRILSACQGDWKSYLVRGLMQHPLSNLVNT